MGVKVAFLPDYPLVLSLLKYRNCGVKELSSPGPLHTRPMPRRKKHPRMNKESPSCQETSSRTILSSANRKRKKKKRHALKDSLPGHPKQKSTNTVSQSWEHGGGAIPGESCHLRIKCPQMTIWPH